MSTEPRNRKIHVVVIGAGGLSPRLHQCNQLMHASGIGGLGAAIAIQSETYQVTVLESAPQLAFAGAGIQFVSSSELRQVS